MQTGTFLDFVAERERIRLKKEAGLPRPWTDDPILRDYKFCCVRREDDRVTKGIAAAYREPYKNDPELWFALLVARRAVNWPDTLADLGFPAPWNPEHFKMVIRSRQASGQKAYEAQAYKVMVSGQAGEQADLIVSHVLNPIWEKRDYYHPRPGDSLSSFAARLSEGPFMGGFYAGQVIADLKYVQLQDAPDWWTFALSGPGSRRGLDRVKGRDPRKYWAEATWYKEFRAFFDTVRGPIEHATGLRLHAQDVQNCLCEYDKLCRLRNGEGSVRRYTPSASNSAAPKLVRKPDDKPEPDKHNWTATCPTEEQIVKPVIKANKEKAGIMPQIPGGETHPASHNSESFEITRHESRTGPPSEEKCIFCGRYVREGGIEVKIGYHNYKIHRGCDGEVDSLRDWFKKEAEETERIRARNAVIEKALEKP